MVKCFVQEHELVTRVGSDQETLLQHGTRQDERRAGHYLLDPEKLSGRAMASRRSILSETSRYVDEYVATACKHN